MGLGGSGEDSGFVDVVGVSVSPATLLLANLEILGTGH